MGTYPSVSNVLRLPPGEVMKEIKQKSSSKQMQSIQCDDQSKPLYSFGTHIEYLTENRNLDICLADFDAVVVTNSAGNSALDTPVLPLLPGDHSTHSTSPQGNILTSSTTVRTL